MVHAVIGKQLTLVALCLIFIDYFPVTAHPVVVFTSLFLLFFSLIFILYMY